MNIHSLVREARGMAAAKERAGDVKARIDEAAIRLFAEIGVDATPVPLIAEKAGVAVGSIYRHYENREDLVRRLYVEHYARLAALLDEAQSAARGTEAKLTAMIRAIVRFVDAEWHVARFLLLEQHMRLMDYEEPANPVDIVREVIAHGIKRGEVRAMDPMVAVALVMGPVVQAATFRTYGRITAPITEFADELVRGCWAAIAERKGRK
jgi:AcrR family transcriptional regulator